MRKILLLGVMLAMTLTANAILPDGSVAEDFTVTDLNGNTHTLYDYLDDGKMVVLDLFATWCVPCWNYHQSHALEDLYQQYGPNGSDEVMVLSIEVDMGTAESCITGHCSNTVGDWTVGISYPIVHATDPSIRNDYNLTYYPTIYTICPDGLVYESGQVSTGQHATWLNSCRFEAILNSVSDVDCYENQNGAIDADYDEGYGGISYQWSNGSTDQDISNLDAGMYSVTMTEGHGREAFLTDVEVLGPTEELDAFVSDFGDVDCHGNANGFVNIDVSGGSGGYIFNWDHGASSQNISGLSGDTYHVVVSDVNGCTKEATQEVYEPDELVLSLSAQDEACDQQNGIIFADAEGGTGQYTFDYGEGSNNDGTFINLAAGFYDVSVSDVNQCATEENIFLANIPAPFGDAGPDKTLDCSTSQSQLSGDGAQGANIAYQWTTNGGNIVDGANTLTPTVDAEGIYDLEVTDNSTGCITTDFVLVSPDPDQPTSHAGPDQDINCNAAEAILDGSASSGGPDIVYQWTTTDGNIVEGGDTPTPTVDAGGTYELEVIDNENGCSALSSVDVEADIDAPNVTIAEHGDLDCMVPQMQLDGSGTDGGPNITYQWSTSDGNIVAGGNTLTPTVDAGGTYTLEAANSGNGCIGSLSTEVEADIDAPGAEAGTDKLLTCAVDQVQLDGSESESGDNITYTWTTSDGNIVEGNDSPSPLVDASGTYTLMVTNNDNGCFMTDAALVNVDMIHPTIDAGPGKTIDCESPTVTLEGSASVEGDDGQIVWTTSDGNIIEGGDGVAPVVNQAGTYMMEVTDASNGCVSSDQVVVDIDADVPVADAGDQRNLTCLVSEVSLDGSGSASGANITYQWSTNNGNIVSGGNTTAPVVDAAGLYSLQVTNTDNNCIAASSVEVTQFDNTPVAEFDFETNDLEVNLENVSTGQDNMLTWDMGNGEVIEGVLEAYTFDEAGEYNVCLTVANECGSNQFCQMVQVAPGQILFETNIKHVSCFGGSDGFIKLDVTSGNEPHVFSWSNGVEDAEATNLEAGSYTVMISDGSGNMTEETFVISEPDEIEMELVEVTDKVGDVLGSIEINVRGGVGNYNYTWSNGETSRNIENLEAGEYSVIVTDENGCEKSFGPYEVQDVTSINEIKSLETFSLYPNPSNAEALIKLTFDVTMSFEVRAYSLNGQLMVRQSFETNEVLFDVGSQLSEAGLYVVEIVTAEGIATKKFLKL